MNNVLKPSGIPAAATLAAVIAAFGWQVSAAAPSAAAPLYHGPRAAAATASTKLRYQAEILPAGTFAIGTSLPSGPDGRGYGYALNANDIDNSWATCKATCTSDFVFFVFTNQADSAKVEFKMVSPTGATVYQYTWNSKLAVGGNWYYTYAKGNYSTPGTYFAEVYVNSGLAGWIPDVFSK